MTKGDYVLATKYNDGDPGDPWAVGYYRASVGVGRHLVEDADGKLLYGPNGFRCVRAGLKPEVGAWLLAASAFLEKAPPGTVSLWTMLSADAWQTD